MVAGETQLIFFMAALLLALTPGPDNLFVLAQAAQYGKRAGITVTLGLCTGLLVHTSAVALGVAAIFQASALAFLPQFTDSARGPLVPQTLLLGALFILSTILIFGGISFLAGGIGSLLRKSAKAQILLNRIAAGVFIALAVKLAMAKR